MKKYDEVKETVFAMCIIPDGYAGNTCLAGIAFLQGRAVFVAACGYFRANGKIYENEAELRHYWANHQKVHFPQVLHNCSNSLEEAIQEYEENLDRSMP